MNDIEMNNDEKRVLPVKENLERYFRKIAELQKEDKPFPVDLDLVWALAYTRKDSCIDELARSFSESVDYQVLRRNPENLSSSDKTDKSKGGRPGNKYFLSLSCMEYLIARKVRPVFEVYRRIFHEIVKIEPMRQKVSDVVNKNSEKKIKSKSGFELTTKSTEEDIREYLLEVKERMAKGDQFPVDIDEVWQIAFAAKRRVYDRLLGINRCPYIYTEDKDFRFEATGIVSTYTGRPRGRYFLSIHTFEEIIVSRIIVMRTIYREVFDKEVLSQFLSAVPGQEIDTNSQELLVRKSEIADAFQRLITVQEKLDSPKDKEAVIFAMKIIGEHNMLLNRLYKRSELKDN